MRDTTWDGRNRYSDFINDLQLAQSALRDAKAEEALFYRIYPRIFRIAVSAVGDRKQAEDVAQLAAMQVLRSLSGFKGLGSIEAWAERIAYRTAIRSIRRAKKESANQFSLQDDDLPHLETPEKTVSRRQLFEALIRKMEHIPKKRRTPLMLHLAYGYTVSEVAELTQASPNTVKARLKKGFRELRKILDEHPNLLAAIEEETP